MLLVIKLLSCCADLALPSTSHPHPIHQTHPFYYHPTPKTLRYRAARVNRHPDASHGIPPRAHGCHCIALKSRVKQPTQKKIGSLHPRYTTWKVDRRNSHVLVYHGPLLIHLLGVEPSTFTTVYQKMATFKRRYIFQTPSFWGIHVKLQGCIFYYMLLT